MASRTGDTTAAPTRVRWSSLFRPVPAPLCTHALLWPHKPGLQSPSTAHGTLVKCPCAPTGPQGRESAGSSFCRGLAMCATARKVLCSGEVTVLGFPAPLGLPCEHGVNASTLPDMDPSRQRRNATRGEPLAQRAFLLPVQPWAASSSCPLISCCPPSSRTLP